MKTGIILLTISAGMAAICNAQIADSAKGVRQLKGEGLYTSSMNDDARKYYEMGHNSFDKGDLKGSVKYYKMAIHLDSAFVDAYDNCGISYRHMNMLDSAIWCYRRSIKQYPKGRLAHMNLAVALSMQNKYDDALGEYDQLQTLDPDDPEAYYGKAHVYLLANNPDKALPNAEKALKLYEKTSKDLVGDAEIQIGICYYSMGDKKNAKKYLVKAKQDGSNIPPRLADDLGIK